MTDIYASPIRGKRVTLSGKVIGKGDAGGKFSEDMMLENETGIIYLNYESWLPWLGNVLFAMKIVNRLIGKDVVADGWFLRGITHWIDLKYIMAENKKIRSYNRLGAYISSVLFILLSFALIVGFSIIGRI